MKGCILNKNIYKILSGGEPYGYIIYIDIGGNICAKNGYTGNIDYKGACAATVIHIAVNALTNGGKIFIKNGTYVLTSTPTIATKYITMEGEGRNAVLKIANNTQKNILNITNNWCVIKNISFDGNNANNTNVVGDYTTQNGIYISGANATNILITDCYIYNTCHEGIHVYNGAKDVIISNNFLKSCGNMGVGNYNGDSIKGSTVSKLTIIGNNIEDSDHGINSYQMTDSIICNNYIKATEGNGIRISASSHRNLIEGNFIYRAHDEGIEVTAGSNYNEIIGNWIYQCAIVSGYGGIRCLGDYTSIINNLIFETQRSYDGISIYTANYIQITGNRCIGNRDGIAINVVTYSFITNNVLENNTRYGLNEVGISDYNNIYQNQFRNNTVAALVKVGTNTKIKDNQGFLTENKGTLVTNGTGLITDFDITHGLVIDPITVELTAKHADSTGDKYWIKKDANTIIVKFITPPPAGTNNVILSWKVEA